MYMDYYDDNCDDCIALGDDAYFDDDGNYINGCYNCPFNPHHFDEDYDND